MAGDASSDRPGEAKYHDWVTDLGHPRFEKLQAMRDELDEVREDVKRLTRSLLVLLKEVKEIKHGG